MCPSRRIRAPPFVHFSVNRQCFRRFGALLRRADGPCSSPPTERAASTPADLLPARPRVRRTATRHPDDRSKPILGTGPPVESRRSRGTPRRVRPRTCSARSPTRWCASTWSSSAADRRPRARTGPGRNAGRDPRSDVHHRRAQLARMGPSTSACVICASCFSMRRWGVLRARRAHHRAQGAGVHQRHRHEGRPGHRALRPVSARL
jgi:hypothetical protein